MNEFESAISEITITVEKKYRKGAPYLADVYGKPHFKVLSVNPLSFEKSGRFKNNLPRFAGSFALASLYVETFHNDAQRAGVIFEASPDVLYGAGASYPLLDSLSERILGPGYVFHENT